MKIKLFFLFLLIFASIFAENSNEQFRSNFRDSINGDWAEQEVILFDTSEADVMIRAGDIDNLGFGWPNGFDPFSGNNTPTHGFPWTPDTTDVSGTDRILVITSYNGSPPHGSDGYTSSTSRPENLPRPITMHYDLLGTTILAASLQMFVDDFQSPVWWADYEVFLNGVQASFLEDIINALVQTGPIGKIISSQIPVAYLYLLGSDSLSVFIDDTTTGAGDGFALDFIKLLINPVGYTYTGTIEGTVTDSVSGLPIEDVDVTAAAIVSDFTDPAGYYELLEVPAGLVYVEASKSGYRTKSSLVNLVAGATEVMDFDLYPLPGTPENITITIANDSVHVSWNAVTDVSSYNIYSSYDPYLDFTSWTLEDNLTDISWNEELLDEKKFYYVKSVE